MAKLKEFNIFGNWAESLVNKGKVDGSMTDQDLEKTIKKAVKKVTKTALKKVGKKDGGKKAMKENIGEPFNIHNADAVDRMSNPVTKRRCKTCKTKCINGKCQCVCEVCGGEHCTDHCEKNFEGVFEDGITVTVQLDGKAVRRPKFTGGPLLIDKDTEEVLDETDDELTEDVDTSGFTDEQHCSHYVPEPYVTMNSAGEYNVLSALRPPHPEVIGSAKTELGAWSNAWANIKYGKIKGAKKLTEWGICKAPESGAADRSIYKKTKQGNILGTCEVPNETHDGEHMKKASCISWKPIKLNEDAARKSKKLKEDINIDDDSKQSLIDALRDHWEGIAPDAMAANDGKVSNDEAKSMAIDTFWPEGATKKLWDELDYSQKREIASEAITDDEYNDASNFSALSGDSIDDDITSDDSDDNEDIDADIDADADADDIDELDDEEDRQADDFLGDAKRVNPLTGEVFDSKFTVDPHDHETPLVWLDDLDLGANAAEHSDADDLDIDDDEIESGIPAARDLGPVKEGKSLLGSNKSFSEPNVLRAKDKVSSPGPILGGDPKSKSKTLAKKFVGCGKDNGNNSIIESFIRMDKKKL